MPHDTYYDFDGLFIYNYMADDDDEVEEQYTATEETPLLNATDNNNVGVPVTQFTNIVLLVVTLLTGFSIGVYLLVLQYNQDHILPPVEELPIRHINKSELGNNNLTVIPIHHFHAETVIIEQTGTEECQSLESCTPLLRKIKEKIGENETIPYNFLLSSDGIAYEGLGWFKLSPLYPELKPLLLKLIGNFENTYPCFEQIDMTKSLITDFLRKDLLIKNYTITGELFDKLKNYPQWKMEQPELLYYL